MRFGIGIAASIVALILPSTSVAARYCWPGFTLPAVHLAAVHLPATTIPGGTIPGGTIPGGCFGGYCYPAVHYKAVHYAPVYVPATNIAATTIAAVHIQRTCFSAGASSFSPARTTVRVSNYTAIDHYYSPQLTKSYGNGAGSAVSIPNPLASGFGELNAAGFPKNQYVRPYVRSNGTFVSGYWRNSPSDGLPTCTIIHC